MIKRKGFSQNVDRKRARIPDFPRHRAGLVVSSYVSRIRRWYMHNHHQRKDKRNYALRDNRLELRKSTPCAFLALTIRAGYGIISEKPTGRRKSLSLGTGETRSPFFCEPRRRRKRRRAPRLRRSPLRGAPACAGGALYRWCLRAPGRTGSACTPGGRAPRPGVYAAGPPRLPAGLARGGPATSAGYGRPLGCCVPSGGALCRSRAAGI